jgi:hypothetical protein
MLTVTNPGGNTMKTIALTVLALITLSNVALADQGAVVVMAPVTIVGHVPHLVCGPMQDNLVGGRNSVCEWK